MRVVMLWFHCLCLCLWGCKWKPIAVSKTTVFCFFLSFLFVVCLDLWLPFVYSFFLPSIWYGKKFVNICGEVTTLGL